MRKLQSLVGLHNNGMDRLFQIHNGRILSNRWLSREDVIQMFLSMATWKVDTTYEEGKCNHTRSIGYQKKKEQET
jgi:hypothetical protein